MIEDVFTCLILHCSKCSIVSGFSQQDEVSGIARLCHDEPAYTRPELYLAGLMHNTGYAQKNRFRPCSLAV